MPSLRSMRSAPSMRDRFSREILRPKFELAQSRHPEGLRVRRGLRPGPRAIHAWGALCPSSQVWEQAKRAEPSDRAARRSASFDGATNCALRDRDLATTREME